MARIRHARSTITAILSTAGAVACAWVVVGGRSPLAGRKSMRLPNKGLRIGRYECSAGPFNITGDKRLELLQYVGSCLVAGSLSMAVREESLLPDANLARANRGHHEQSGEAGQPNRDIRSDFGYSLANFKDAKFNGGNRRL